MIVCKQCGHHNEDNDTFCGSCGKFLEWTGERVAVAEPEAAPPAPEPEPEPEPAKAGFFDRVKQAVGMDDAPAAATTAGPATPAVAPAPTPVSVTSASPNAVAPVAAAAAPASPVRPAAAEPVLAGVAAAPVATPTAEPASRPPSAEPASRLPTQAPVVRKTTPRPTTPSSRPLRPDDLICGQCGEGNDQERHFCRRCGASLAEAVVVQQPWYRRLFNRLFGPRRYSAGERRRRVGPPNVMGGVMRVVRLAIAALLILAVLAFLLIPPFHDRAVSTATTAYNAVRKILFPHIEQVYPVQAAGSTQTAGHPANLAIDRAKNTYWAAAANDPHPQLTVRFASPVDLADIGFTSGASGATPADFVAQPRPHAVHLIFEDAKGGLISAKDLQLADSSDFQHFAIDAKQATVVVIQIQSTDAATGVSPSSVALAEVEFHIKN